jgi:alpha-L-fucosidase 2
VVALGAQKTPTTLPAGGAEGVRFDGEAARPAEPLALWYRRPATTWTEALPVGNARQGGMMFGGVLEDVICLNEGTLWAGGPYDPANPKAAEALPKVRELLFAGKYAEAQRLVGEQMMATPSRQMPYQPVGDLLLNFPKVSAVREYRRELNLRTGVTAVSYTVPGSNGGPDVKMTRELFASYPDNVLVLRLTADRPGQVNFLLGARSDQREPSVAVERVQGKDREATLILRGANIASNGVAGALKFDCRARVVAEGGQVGVAPATRPAVNADPAGVQVTGADAVTIVVATATSYKGFNDVGGDPARVAATVETAAAKGHEALRREHVADHEGLFGRVAIDLGSNAEAEKLPTNERVGGFASAGDPQLAALYFQYGRYLLIGSSRRGGQPANLQGIWNDLTAPPWGSKYTININTEMNYWPVDSTNVGECLEPLMSMVEDLVVTGGRTARVQYGAGGWVTHHNTDLWRASAPIDGPQYGMWPTGGAWLCNTLFDHYRFTRDKAFLKRLYPAMKGSVEFVLETLVEEPRHHWLVTAPSMSPEHAHASGVSLAPGPTMDMQILRDLFAHSIEASEVLGVDEAFRQKAAAARARLAPNQVGAAGQLQEWLEDWDMQAPDLHHRHVSHLYGFFPGADIELRRDPALAAAVRKSLEIRGDNATGWGLGWRLNLWARLQDAEHAYAILQLLLSPAKTYPNLFDAHPPFQIDGNFGGTSGIAEMLVQSHTGEIELLPALPRAWPTGSVRGLRARGGYEVEMQWSGGKLTAARVRNVSGEAGTVRVRVGEKVQEVTIGAGEGTAVGM